MPWYWTGIDFFEFVNTIAGMKYNSADGEDQMPTYPRELAADLKDGVVVPLVGAGLSIPSNLPTWPQLIEQLLDELQSEDEVKRLRERFREGSLGATAVPELYALFKAKHSLLAFIKRKLGKAVVPNEYHRLVCDLRARTLLTTNFDNLIEDAHNARGQGVNKIWKNEQLAFYNEHQAVQVVKIHGTIEDIDTVVFSKSDYETFKRDRILIYHFVATLFATKTILFLGTSLNDLHLREIFEDVKARIDPAMRPHYALMNRPNPETRNVLRTYGIRSPRKFDPPLMELSCGIIWTLVSFNKSPGISSAIRLGHKRACGKRQRSALGSRSAPQKFVGYAR